MAFPNNYELKFISALLILALINSLYGLTPQQIHTANALTEQSTSNRTVKKDEKVIQD
jgi:hypothetical protein